MITIIIIIIIIIICQSQFQCAKASFKKGKLASTGNIIIDDETEIQKLDQEGVYKYLGVDESEGIQHSKMKEKIRKEYIGE